MFTYILVEVEEPSVRMYREPLAAEWLGAPEPAWIVTPCRVIFPSKDAFVPDESAIVFVITLMGDF